MSKKIQLQVVTLEQAKRLKTLGFDWECVDYYNIYDETPVDSPIVGSEGTTIGTIKSVGVASGKIFAPMVAFALKWARDVHSILCVIERSSDFCFWWRYDDKDGEPHYDGEPPKDKYYDTYEVAETALLDAVLDEIEKARSGQ